MRRRSAPRRGRAIWILIAGIGYLVGGWNAAALRSAQPSTPTPAQTVALRFPKDMRGLPVVQAAAVYRDAFAGPVMPEADLAIFEPEPMAPAQPVPQTQVRTPADETADIAPAPRAVRTAAAVPEISPQRQQQIAARPRPIAPRHAVGPRYMLDDAQIASIKRRLHLTPDQERMWPAVETALRNIGVEKERELRARGSAAAIDPDSSEVQDLKSAAIPLLMSFSDEQKDEVRSVARGMGLNQLASEF